MNPPKNDNIENEGNNTENKHYFENNDQINNDEIYSNQQDVISNLNLNKIQEENENPQEINEEINNHNPIQENIGQNNKNENDNTNNNIQDNLDIEHINEIKKIHKFEHTLFEEEDCYTLHMELNAPRMYHKVILSWIRYTYEFPFNVTIYEAFKLKEIHGFKQLGLLNLFNIIGPSTKIYKHGCDIHAIGCYDRIKKLISWKEFKSLINKAIKNNKRGQINDIIPTKHLDIQYIEVPNGHKITNSNYWLDETEFAKRVKVYKNNKKVIKEMF
jgi:hypothetical protein